MMVTIFTFEHPPRTTVLSPCMYTTIDVKREEGEKMFTGCEKAYLRGAEQALGTGHVPQLKWAKQYSHTMGCMYIAGMVKYLL